MEKDSTEPRSSLKPNPNWRLERYDPNHCAIRSLPDNPFDFLAGGVYNAGFSIAYAGVVPLDVAKEQAKFVRHTNACRFLMKKTVLSDPRVVDMASRLAAA